MCAAHTPYLSPDDSRDYSYVTTVECPAGYGLEGDACFLCGSGYWSGVSGPGLCAHRSGFIPPRSALVLDVPAAQCVTAADHPRANASQGTEACADIKTTVKLTAMRVCAAGWVRPMQRVQGHRQPRPAVCEPQRSHAVKRVCVRPRLRRRKLQHLQARNLLARGQCQ